MGKNDLVEAREWFSKNAGKNKFAFAGNCFGSTEDAKAFVEDLYRLGAMEVFVGGRYADEWRMEEEGGEYAATLYIILPETIPEELMLKMIAIHPDEADIVKQGGRKMIRLWWD